MVGSGHTANVQVIDAAEVTRRLAWPDLLDAIAARLGAPTDADAPPRWILPAGDTLDAELNVLVIPPWTRDGLLGVKLLNHVPGHADPGIPTIQASYVALSATTP